MSIMVSKRTAILALTAAAALITTMATGGTAAPSTATTPSAADTLDFARSQLALCQVELRTATDAAARNRAQNCINDAQRAIADLTRTPSPSPSPTPTPSTPRTTPPATAPATTGAPTPTATTASPSPGPTSMLRCMDNPAACGYPDATNTGVPAGTNLTVTGGVTFSTPGTYSGLDIHGCVTVTSTGVTLTRSRVSGCTGPYAVRVDSSNAGFVMSDSEIIMQGDQKGLVFVGYTAQRVKVWGTGDCFGTGTNSVIIDSFCENGPGNSPKRAPNYTAEPSWCEANGAHWDGVEAGATTRTIIRHNTFRLPCGQTGAVNVSDWNGPITPGSVVVDNNLMAGGSWTVYGGGDTVRIVLTNNRFSRWYWPGGGSANADEAVEGYCWNASPRSGNVWDETGQPTASLNA